MPLIYCRVSKRCEDGKESFSFGCCLHSILFSPQCITKNRYMYVHPATDRLDVFYEPYSKNVNVTIVNPIAFYSYFDECVSFSQYAHRRLWLILSSWLMVPGVLDLRTSSVSGISSTLW